MCVCFAYVYTHMHICIYMYVCMLSCFIHVQLFVMLWTVAHQAPLFMGFSRQEYWSGLPCPPPGDLPDPGVKPVSLMPPTLAGRFFTTSTTREVLYRWRNVCVCVCLFARATIPIAWGHFAKRNKWDTERQILQDITCMWNLKKILLNQPIETENRKVVALIKGTNFRL